MSHQETADVEVQVATKRDSLNEAQLTDIINTRGLSALLVMIRSYDVDLDAVLRVVDKHEESWRQRLRRSLVATMDAIF